MLAIYKKELRCFFSSMIAPAVIAFILMFAGLFVSLGSLFSLAASIETSYTNTLFVLLIAVPLLSMRSLAREKSSGTQKLLDSLPVSPVTYIIGKFFAKASDEDKPPGFVIIQSAASIRSDTLFTKP